MSQHRERVEFINDMVTNAVWMLTGLSSRGEKADLLPGDLLPSVLSQFPSLGEELEKGNRVALDPATSSTRKRPWTKPVMPRRKRDPMEGPGRSSVLKAIVVRSVECGVDDERCAPQKFVRPWPFLVSSSRARP